MHGVISLLRARIHKKEETKRLNNLPATLLNLFTRTDLIV